MTENKDIIKAIMIGHATGDALGVPVEFCTREELDKSPVTDMEGYGSYPVPEGCWSDDTSMSLAALDSLKEGKLDFEDIMGNFLDWLYGDKYTPTGQLFDIGHTCLDALKNYRYGEGRAATECGMDGEYSNGNGSLMRIHPFVLYAYAKNMSIEDTMTMIDLASAMTHAHNRSKLACKIYAFVLLGLLRERSIFSIERSLVFAKNYLRDEEEISHFERLFSKDFKETPREEINSSAYVVDTLEAAIWCVLTTKGYKECVLKAANLGKDTDTVAAIAGGLAAALYGYDSIPKSWRDTLKRRDYIELICDTCAERW